MKAGGSMIKLIALDIDGTLYNSQGEVSALTRFALKKAHEKGIKLMLASGRSIHGLKQLAQRNGLPLDNMIYLGFNGACVAEGEKSEIVFEFPLELDLAKRLIKQLKKYPVTILLPHRHELWVDDPKGHLVEFECETECLTMKVIDDLINIDFEPNKVVISCNPEYLKPIQIEMDDLFRNEANVVISGPFYLDFTGKDIDKGASLKRYCELKGIDASEVIAFGDNYNDVTMIEFAGMGVAMGNAIPNLKSIANVVTTTNDEDGIALILKKVLE